MTKQNLVYPRSQRKVASSKVSGFALSAALLRPDPAQRPRLAAIRDNLHDRITEAHQHHWAGEAEGLKVSLAAATGKLTQMDELAARQATTVDLSMPAFTHTASRTVTTPGRPPHQSANLTRITVTAAQDTDPDTGTP